MSLLYGVYPILDKTYKNMQDINKSSLQKSLETGLVEKGDKIVLVSGLVAGKSGSNLMLIEKI